MVAPPHRPRQPCRRHPRPALAQMSLDTYVSNGLHLSVWTQPSRPSPSPGAGRSCGSCGRRSCRRRDIADGSPTSRRPAISQHLAVLKDAELVTERRDGTRRLYRANTADDGRAARVPRRLLDVRPRATARRRRGRRDPQATDERTRTDGRARPRDHDRRHARRRSGRSSPNPTSTSSGSAPSPTSTRGPGGIYRVLVGGKNQSAGEYVEVVPHEKVVFTFGWEQEGNPITPGSSTVEITLHPEGDKTASGSCTAACPTTPVTDHTQRLGPLPRPPRGRGDRRRRRARRPPSERDRDRPTHRSPRRTPMTDAPHRHRRRAPRRTRLELLQGREGADPPQRRARPQRRELPWVRDRQGLPVRHRGRRGHARRPVPRPLAARSCTTSCTGPTGTRAARAARRSPTASTRRICTSRTTTSRSPRCRARRSPKLLAYRDRMGWSFPWASSARERLQLRLQRVVHRGVGRDAARRTTSAPLEGWQVDPANLPFEGPGMSAFVLDDGVVYHTYSAYSRGARRAVDHVAVARPRAARSQRGRPLVVPPPRHVRGQLPVMLAHIAGVPVEEWIVTVLASGGGFAVAVRAAWRRRGA